MILVPQSLTYWGAWGSRTIVSTSLSKTLYKAFQLMLSTWLALTSLGLGVVTELLSLGLKPKVCSTTAKRLSKSLTSPNPLFGFISARSKRPLNSTPILSLTWELSCLIVSLIVSIVPSSRIFSSRNSFSFTSSNFNFLFISVSLSKSDLLKKMILSL